MKMKGTYLNKLLSSIFVTLILIYFMIKNTSSKIIFIPFLICSISMFGKYLALTFKQDKMATIFRKVFTVGFLLFWFGFLVVALFICIRDKQYSILLYMLPFWMVGAYITKRRIWKNQDKYNDKRSISMGIVVSSALVVIALIVGTILFIRGIMVSNYLMLFAGGFFALGSFTFILVALTIKGCFDRCKVDVLGLYIGVVFIIIGIGFSVIIYLKKASVLMIITLLMAVMGILQVIKCLKKIK